MVESKKRLSVQIFGLGEPAYEVCVLFEREGVAKGQVFHVVGVAVMVAKFMPGLGNSQFRDGQPLSLIPTAEGGHTGGIRLESQNHKVIDGTEIFACLSLGLRPGWFAYGLPRRFRDGGCPARHRPARYGSRFREPR